MDADLGWDRGCFDVHTTLNFPAGDENTRRLKGATRTPPGSVLHLVNVAEREGIDSGKIDLIKPRARAPPSM